VDPQTITLYTAANYAIARQSWQDLVEMFGLTEYRAPRMNAAYQLWATNAPECTAGDDWSEAAQEWHRTYLANQAAA